MDWWLAYLAIGATVGFLAGLLGIGGGMVMVPTLAFVFTAKGFPLEHLMHLSLATSMATIPFTSVASVGAHHRHGAVDWAVAKSMAPGIVAGALLCSEGRGRTFESSRARQTTLPSASLAKYRAPRARIRSP